MRLSRRRWSWVLALLVLSLSTACIWRWRTIHRSRLAMASIQAAMAAGHRGTAAQGLTSLLSESPDPDKVAYMLGVCERGRGRGDAADTAWAQVTPGSALSARAVEARMLLRVDSGQLAAAEQLIEEAAADPRNDGTALRILLVPTYLLEGRRHEAEGLIHSRLRHLRQTGESASHTAIVLARLLFQLDHPPGSTDTTQADLDRAGRLAPNDDRVWLGKANLAIRAGSLDEAARWLDACLRLRPADVSVWRARMRLGMAAGKVALVTDALQHLPATASTPAEAHQIQGWLARQQGNEALEQQELALWLAVSPDDRSALDRLIEKARATGPADQLAQWQRHQTEMDRIAVRYKKMVDRNQPIRDSIELGDLAQKLGRPFEAGVYLALAAAESPQRAQARRDLERLESQGKAEPQPTGSLSQLVGIAAADSGSPQLQSNARPQNP